jgi:hypothetical protein
VGRRLVVRMQRASAVRLGRTTPATARLTCVMGHIRPCRPPRWGILPPVTLTWGGAPVQAWLCQVRNLEAAAAWAPRCAMACCICDNNCHQHVLTLACCNQSCTHRDIAVCVAQGGCFLQK